LQHTAICIDVYSKYHRGETRTVECARKAFYYRRSISRQACIFNPDLNRPSQITSTWTITSLYNRLLPEYNWHYRSFFVAYTL